LLLRLILIYKHASGWLDYTRRVNIVEAKKLRIASGDRMSLIVGVVTIGLLIVTFRLWLRRHRPLIRTPERKDRRHGYRVALATPVFVYGWQVDEPFSQNTETLNVSAVGGLIPLSATVIPSQELILTNLQTNEDLPCRVARSVKAEDGKILAGLEFLKRSPNFWQIDFVSVPPHSPIEPPLNSKLKPALKIISNRYEDVSSR